MKGVNEKILHYARDLLSNTDAQAIVLYADALGHRGALDHVLGLLTDLPVVLATRMQGEPPADGHRTILLPEVNLSRFGQIRMAVLLGLTQGLFRQGQRLVCLSGLAGSDVLDTLVYLELGEEFELYGSFEAEYISQHVRPEVFEGVLRLAITLGHEGREGHPVGTIFVLGDNQNVLRYAEQLVLNPFQGHSEEARNVLDPALTETIKEFASIDGAFIIRGDGVVVTAGAFLRSPAANIDLPAGLGTRHKSAAALSAVTDAVTIAVSQSTGNVTVFRKGRIVIELARRRAVRQSAAPAPPPLPPDITPLPGGIREDVDL